MEALFACLITLQLVVVGMHDLVDIPGWTHGAQVRATLGTRKLWLATLINSMFPGAAVAFAFYFWHQPKPRFVANYWLLYCAVTLISAIAMWYVPYFFGATDEQKRFYSQIYAGTRQVLPPRGENPRPNLLHLLFHILFVINFFLVLVLRYRGT